MPRKTVPMPPLPSWYPDNPPAEVTINPPAQIAPKIAAYVLDQLPEFFYDSAYAPLTIEVISYSHALDDDDPRMKAIQDDVWNAEKAIASRFAVAIQQSGILDQLRSVLLNAMTTAMTK